MNNFQLAALCISMLALVVSVLTFIFHRRDKSVERINQLQASQKAALERVESALVTRIGGIETITNERHDANLDRLRGMETKLAHVDEAVKHIPTQHDLGMLSQQISLVSSNVAKLQGSQEANTRMVERMNQYLMERGT